MDVSRLTPMFKILQDIACETFLDPILFPLTLCSDIKSVTIREHSLKARVNPRIMEKCIDPLGSCTTSLTMFIAYDMKISVELKIFKTFNKTSLSLIFRESHCHKPT